MPALENMLSVKPRQGRQFSLSSSSLASRTLCAGSWASITLSSASLHSSDGAVTGVEGQRPGSRPSSHVDLLCGLTEVLSLFWVSVASQRKVTVQATTKIPWKEYGTAIQSLCSHIRPNGAQISGPPLTCHVILSLLLHLSKPQVPHL